MRAVRVERIHATLLEQIEDILLQHWQHGVKAVLQIGEIHLLRACAKYLRKNGAFVRSQLVPLIHRLLQMKDVVVVLAQEAFARGVLDFDIALHGQINQRGADVTWVE